jgi:hypothetical protein
MYLYHFLSVQSSLTGFFSSGEVIVATKENDSTAFLRPFDWISSAWNGAIHAVKEGGTIEGRKAYKNVIERDSTRRWIVVLPRESILIIVLAEITESVVASKHLEGVDWSNINISLNLEGRKSNCTDR